MFDVELYGRRGPKRSQMGGTELHLGAWYGMEPFSAICGEMHVVRGNYGTPPLGRYLPWPYYYFHINRFHVDDLLKEGSKQSEE